MNSVRSAGLLRQPAAAPPGSNRGGEHYFHNFCVDEEAKTEVRGLCQRMGEDIEPGQSARKEHDLSQQTGDRGAQESPGSALEKESGDEGHQRIDHQKPTGRTEQMRDSARTGGT